MVLFSYLPNFQINPPYYYHLFRQQVSNHISKRPPVSCPDQTYWHQIPFYSIDHWRRENTADLLPHWRYDSWRIYKDTFFYKSQAFPCHESHNSAPPETRTCYKRPPGATSLLWVVAEKGRLQRRSQNCSSRSRWALLSWELLSQVWIMSSPWHRW